MLTISLILLPLLVSLFWFLFKDGKGFKEIALATSLAELGLACFALFKYNNSQHLNFGFHVAWIKSWGINLAFAMDGLSLVLVILTAMLIPIIIFSTFHKQNNYSAGFYALILLMEAALIGVFTSFDGFMFYIFWELALIPVYFICGLWGGENRIKITLKFFIYTMLGSLFMFVALIWLYIKTPAPHSFGIGNILNAPLSFDERFWISTFFFLGFAIKIPIFPFHSWQPNTYTNAPTVGSMLLAGIMLKMGLYGLLRFLLPISGDLLAQYGPFVLYLSLIGLLYGSIIAIKQQEIKRLIAYSSLSHVGLMALAIFTAKQDTIQGAIYQMLAHGFNVTALFFIAEIISRRTKTTAISELGGIAKNAPYFAIFFMVVMLGSVAVPLTNGFVGEFLMLTGIAQYNFPITIWAGLSVILGAVYMFWLYQRTMYGEAKANSTTFADLTTNEMIIAVPLVIIIIAMGVYPKPILSIVQPAVESILKMI